MKLLFVVNKLTERGGEEVAVAKLIKAFKQYHEVNVYSTSMCNKNGWQKHSTHFCPALLSRLLDLKRSLVVEKFDAIHFHNPLHFFVFYSILSLRHKNKICTFHSKHYSPIWWKAILLGAYRSAILLVLPLFVDKFIFLTEFDRWYFSRWFFLKRRSWVAVPGIEPEWLNDFKGKKLGERPRILFVGKLKKSKGFVDLIKLAKTMPAYDFWIAGAGNVVGLLPENIKLFGWLSRQEMREVYQSADLFLLPSYSECFPMSILEAMACGLPIICSRIGGLSEIVKEGVNGRLVRAGSREEIKLAIINLVDDRKLYQKISQQNIKEAREKYSLIKKINAHLEVYNG